MAPLASSLVSLLTILGLFTSGVLSTTFTMVNKCEYTVWPGILTNAGVPPLPTTGFALQKGETKTISAPTSWGGRFWGRTLCSQDSSGKFSCVTGDCGSGKVECAGNGAAPPATLAEFTLDGSGGLDFFDVSLVDGYNLPMLVVPQGGSGTNCSNTGCVVDLNGLCPSELKQERVSGTEHTATAYKYYFRYTVVYKQLTGADKQHNGILWCLVRSKPSIVVHAYYVTCNCGFGYRRYGHSAAVAARLLTSSVRVAHNLGPIGDWTTTATHGHGHEDEDEVEARAVGWKEYFR
ncbi:hypothetical protein ACE6H2_003705 [Prunus campanulata]